MSPQHFIKDQQLIPNDPWQIVRLPAAPEQPIRRAAGKPVLFKLTGEEHVSAEQLANAIIPAGQIIVPLTLWQARRESLQSRLAAGELGIWLDTHEPLEALTNSIQDLHTLPVIGVHFERFADGRGYSLATRLRNRHGYQKELRAFGDILRDQLFALSRCGFNAYHLRADRDPVQALEGFKVFSDPYQHAADKLAPLWRRHERGH